MPAKHNKWLLTPLLLLGCPFWAWTQPAVTAGTLEGTVVDPSGAVLVGASAEIVNRLSGYHRSTTTDSAGRFRFDNIPPNPYHLDVKAPGFAEYSQDLQVRGAIPVTIRVPLVIAAGQTAVNVEAFGADLVENVPYAHSDVDKSTYAMLPASSPGSGLSNAVTLSTPGVAADSNGFFHPLGDHAQVTFSIDGQPVSDQQSKQFSTQIPLNAIQSLEVITGAPPAEYGDKTSLVLNAVTRSAVGQAKPSGSFVAQYGSFGTISEDGSLGFGNAKLGNFLAVNTIRSGRFLDTPEFRPIHAAGNNQTIFDRFDYRPRTADAFHLNLLGARNWFQTPNTYDQPGQDQRQKVLTLNLAPGFQHIFSASTLLTVNTFFRQDRVNYYPSSNPFDDTPATVSQRRSLSNWGTKADVSHVHGKHTLKFGLQLMQTRLHERFTLGVTDPDLGLQPGLAPFDLTRGGRLLQFSGKTNINQAAFFGEDSMVLGNLNLTAGLRIDRYQGLSDANGVQPRLGVSYLAKRTGTVLRAAYSRTLETPYNENLILSSATGQGGLEANVFGGVDAIPIQPGRRNQYNVGIQQSVDRLLRVDADYFWKFTKNAFDFGALLNTPIQFPISWRQSKIDGVAVRLSTPSLHGIQVLVTMGHTRARYFGPSNGGLIFNSPLNTGAFRIDHDQVFQQTANLRYQRPKAGPWISFTWRYDSGLIAGAVPDLQAALTLTAAQQAAIGFFCGGAIATRSNPITSCGSPSYGAERLRIPAAGTADPDRNPPRITPRHIFSIATGSDNLFHTDPVKTTLRFEVVNLTNQVALYNFLSTFSGTHFVAPRTFQAELGIAF